MKNKQYEYYHNEKIYTLKEFEKFCVERYEYNEAFKFQKGKDVITKTYKEFFDDAAKLGSYILSRNYNKKAIAILGENSYEWLVSYFAIANSGNIVVPIDKELPVESVKNIINETETVYIFYANTYLDYITDILNENSNVKAISFEDVWENILNRNFTEIELKEYKDIEISSKDILTINYTSGTTGMAKGIVLTHKNVCINFVSGMQSLKMYGSTLLTLPLNHLYALTGNVLCVMFWGCSIYICKSIKNLMKDLQEQKPTFILTVPLMMETFYKQIWKNAKASKKDKTLRLMLKISSLLYKCNIDVRRKMFKSVLKAFGGNLEFIVCGGAKLDPEYQKDYINMGIDVVIGYGITECAPFIAVNRNKYYKIGSAGLPLTCSNVKISDEDGEILVKGDMVMKEYFKNPKLTNEVMDGEYFRTGDIGYMDEEGFIFISGRKKNVIVLSNGKNVYPEEIEFELMKYEVIKEVIVKEKDKTITAEIFVNEDYIKEHNIQNKEEYINQVIQEVNKKNPLYKYIENVEFRDTAFEKTTSNKIKRKYVKV